MRRISLVALTTALLARPLYGDRVRSEYSFSDPTNIGK